MLQTSTYAVQGCLVISVEHHLMASLDALSALVVKCTEQLASRFVPSDGAREHVVIDPVDWHKITYLRPAAGPAMYSVGLCQPAAHLRRWPHKPPYYPVGLAMYSLARRAQ